MDMPAIAVVERTLNELGDITRESLSEFSDAELYVLYQRWMAEPYHLLIQAAVKNPNFFGTMIGVHFLRELLRRIEVAAMSDTQLNGGDRGTQNN
jgi:hypothetical protein